MNAFDALRSLWLQAGLPEDALSQAQLPGADPVLPSSFAVGTAAQCSIAAAALAACELGHQRGAERQAVSVDMQRAALECTGWFSLDGRVPELWDAVLAHRDAITTNGVLAERREFRLREELRAIVARRLEQKARAICGGERWEHLQDEVFHRRLDPWGAADEMLGGVDA